MAEEARDRLESMDLAIQNEKREMEFYQTHASRTSHPLGKKMFQSLARDEREHMDKIRQLHSLLLRHGHWPEDLPLEVGGTNVQEVLKSVTESLKDVPEANRDDLEAVRIAIDFEAKGEAFYSQLASKCEDPKEKGFFKFLASMEHQHLLSLKDTLAYFEDPEGWFASRERHTLDGA